MHNLREELQGGIAFALVELGLSEEEFLRQTPREWQIKMQAWDAREKRLDRRVARLCNVVARAAGCNVSEEDFMPQPVDHTPQSPEEMINALRSINSPNG